MERVEDDNDSDIDTEEIKGQLKTMQDALQRHFGHHKVSERSRTVFQSLISANARFNSNLLFLFMYLWMAVPCSRLWKTQITVEPG